MWHRRWWWERDCLRPRFVWRGGQDPGTRQTFESDATLQRFKGKIRCGRNVSYSPYLKPNTRPLPYTRRCVELNLSNCGFVALHVMCIRIKQATYSRVRAVGVLWSKTFRVRASHSMLAVA
jgi:hypothetical protein